MPNISDAVNFTIESFMQGVHTSIPAKIHEYDSATNKAQVKPLIKKLNQDETYTELPIIVNVPVEWVSGATWGFKGPLVQGDLGRLIFAETSIDKWLSLEPGTDVEPDDPRRFDLNDAIFIPGLKPFKNYESPDTNNTDIIIYTESGEIRIGPDYVSLMDGTIRIEDCSIAIGCPGQSINLLEEISNLVQALIDARVATSIGPQPLDPATQVLLAQIKGKVDTITGTF